MNEFMQLAIEEARLGLSEGGIPIGAVLVAADGAILGRGHNRRVQQRDPIMHAEINALQNAGRVGSYAGATMYSTLMPCYMCAGAMVQFQISTVVTGENETFQGGHQFMVDHGIEVINLDLDECKELLQTFARKNPQLWAEDIGELESASALTD